MAQHLKVLSPVLGGRQRVLEGIGVGSGPPFPRGNTLEAGDLSLLDPVIAHSKTYRR